MFFNDTVYGGHAEPAALEFCREKGLEDPVAGLFIHALTVVRNAQQHLGPRFQALVLLALRFTDYCVF